MSGHVRFDWEFVLRVLSVSSGSGGTRCAGMCSSKRILFENVKKGALSKRLTFV